MVLSIDHVTKSFGTDVILEDITGKIEDRDRIGLIGVNGAGKTTLLNLLVGALSPDPDTGTISVAGKTRIGFLRQNSGLNTQNEILQEMQSVFEPVYKMEKNLRQLEKEIAQKEQEAEDTADLLAQYAALDEAFSRADGYLTEVKINTILNGMGFGEKAQNTIISTLSGGEKTRLAIAKLLLEEPNLLILDEPTNHLDFKTLTWLEGYLSNYKGALLIVSHDRYFLDKLVTQVWEVEQHRLFTYKGNYTKYIDLKKERRDRQQKEYDMQQKEIASMEDFIARNLVRASTTKRAQSRIAALARMQRIEKPFSPPKTAKLSFDYEQEPVRDVLLVENMALSVGEGDEKLHLMQNITLHVLRGQKIAIIGDNGVGKSTFLKVLTQEIKPESGQFSWGRNVKIGYFEQELKSLNPRKSALQEVWDRYPALSEFDVRSVLGRVLLTGEAAYKPVSILSGGEKAKLAFALLMLAKSNVLLMDEPTNHLDLQTKEILEEALMRFSGTLLMVSHDRYMLNKVPDYILEFSKTGVSLYTGGYDAYFEKKNASSQKDLPQKTEQPAKQEKTGTVKTAQQRREEAQKRQTLRELEGQIAALEESVRILEQEILTPQVYEDYQLMNEKCTRLEEEKKQLAELGDQWLLLNE